MRQVIQSYRTGELKVVNVPLPALAPGQVLVQSAFSAVSLGTEGKKVMTARQSLIGKARSRPELVRQVIRTARREGLLATYRKVMNRLDEPVPLGYSAAGTVIAAGRQAESFRVGDRVACGGETAAHGEVMAIPVNLCAAVPEGVSLEHAAFTTIGAIALQGLRQAGVTVGECVAVIGLGLVGQLTMQLLKASGCRAVGLDVDAEKVALAENLGAAYALRRQDPNLEAVMSALSRGFGVDAVLVTAATTSTDPMELAARICRDRGRIVVVGGVPMNLPREPSYYKELEVRLSRSYGPGRYDPAYEAKGLDYPIGYVRWTEKRNMEAFLDLLATGQINLADLITHRFPFDRAEEAYDLLASKPAEGGAKAIGILFEYDVTKDHLEPAARRVYTGARSTRPPRADVGVGFIGAGSFARKFLIPPLAGHRQARLVAVATATGMSGDNTARKFGFAYSTDDAQQVLDDPEIQAIFIATRHDLHASLTVRALQAGKAVFVEKPLALNEAQLADVVSAYRAAAEFNGQPPNAMVGFNRRFAPYTQAVRSFFDGRAEPMAVCYRVNAGYLDAGHWYHDPEAGGGRIVGEACHFVDFIAYLVGRPIQTVYAARLDNAARYYGDNAALTLTFADGSMGNVLYLANGDTGLSKERVEIYCQGKTAVLDDFSRLELYQAGRQSVKTMTQDKGHTAEVLAFLETVRTGRRELPAPFELDLQSTSATLAAVNSMALGLPLAKEDEAWHALAAAWNAPPNE